MAVFEDYETPLQFIKVTDDVMTQRSSVFAETP